MIKIIEMVIAALIIFAGSLSSDKIIFNNFLLLFQFMTRIPIKLSLACGKKNFKKASLFFPVVGLIIGLLQFWVFYFSSMVLPILISSIITVLCGILITGGLHMDGFSDMCDGFFSGRGKEQTIDIMKDSRVGSFGSIAMVFDIAVKVAGIYYLGVKNQALTIIAIPIISRLFTVLACLIGENAKEKGTGNLYIGNTSIGYLIGAAILGVTLSNLFISIKLILVFAAAGAAVTIIFNFICNWKIGGHTGDTLGANNELVEIILFIISSSTLI